MDPEQKEISERIRIAREHKAKTCGRMLTSSVFGEPEPKWVERRFVPKTVEKLSDSREYRFKYNLERRISEARRKQVTHGGTYGIVRDTRMERNRVRYRVFVGYVKVFDCPLDAAEFRNSVMRQKYPGVPEFQIEPDAVWRKWGCGCGKHKRPES